MVKRVLFFVFTLMVMVFLSGCGKKGDPVPKGIEKFTSMKVFNAERFRGR